MWPIMTRLTPNTRLTADHASDCWVIWRQSGRVLHAYQHDLQEFGIGLKKETAAVARLPLYLESAASVGRVPPFTVVGPLLELLVGI
jgi:hypothetical protein